MYVTDSKKFMAYLVSKRDRAMAAWAASGYHNCFHENRAIEYGRKISLFERELERMAKDVS